MVWGLVLVVRTRYQLRQACERVEARGLSLGSSAPSGRKMQLFQKSFGRRQRDLPRGDALFRGKANCTVIGNSLRGAKSGLERIRGPNA